MVNPFQEVNWNPDTAATRKFAVSLIIGLPAVALILLLARGLFGHSWQTHPAMWIAVSGVVLGGIFWIAPPVARPFYFVWYFVACCIGIVIGNVLVLAFFFTVILLLGLLLRPRLTLRKAPTKSANSYWNKVEQDSDSRRYYQQF